MKTLAPLALALLATQVASAEVEVQPDARNIIANRLAGSWALHPDLSKRLTGDASPRLTTVAFEPDAKALAKLPARLLAPLVERKIRVYQAGHMRFLGRDAVYALIAEHGRTICLFYMKKGERWDGESCHLMLAQARERTADLLFVGGDTVREPFLCFQRSNEAGTETDARRLLAEFTAPGANVKALTRKLQPREGDYAKVFKPEAAERAKAAYEQMWKSFDPEIAPGVGQTRLRLLKATPTQLQDPESPAARNMPGGLVAIAEQLQPGRVWYRFAFTKPKESSGRSFVGLVWVDDHWAMFFKPWRALR